RKRVAQALGNLGDERIIEPLLKVFEEDPAIRLEAALAVAKVKPVRSVHALVTLATEDPTDAGEAVEILVDVLGGAAAQITPDELKEITLLPKAIEAGKESGSRPGVLRSNVDASGVAKLATDELVRRGLMAEPTAPAIRKSADSRAFPRKPTASIPVLILHG